MLAAMVNNVDIKHVVVVDEVVAVDRDRPELAGDRGFGAGAEPDPGAFLLDIDDSQTLERNLSVLRGDFGLAEPAPPLLEKVFNGPDARVYRFTGNGRGDRTAVAGARAGSVCTTR